MHQTSALKQLYTTHICVGFRTLTDKLVTGGVAQWLGRWSLHGGLLLTCAWYRVEGGHFVG